MKVCDVAVTSGPLSAATHGRYTFVMSFAGTLTFCTLPLGPVTVTVAATDCGLATTAVKSKML